MYIRLASIFFVALFSGAVLAAQPAVDQLTQPCAECHGLAGASNLAKTPHLNGQLASYLEEEISGYARSLRVSSIPNHVPKTWSGAEIAAVAKFYASSKAVRLAQQTDPEMVAKGEILYKKRCAECHPDNGRASDHDAPLMAGQNVEYLMEQTRAFVSGQRKFVFMMDDAFRGLSPVELDSVVHFFASQNQNKNKK